MTVSRSPLNLAALATVALPGFTPVGAQPTTGPPGTDAALVQDSHRRHWLVLAPQHGAAGAALEAEAALLKHLKELSDSGTLSFDVLDPKGWAPLEEGGNACIYTAPSGDVLDFSRIEPRSRLARNLGRMLGAIHEIPHSTPEDLGFATYDSEEYRARRLVELDEAARTAHIPTRLLRRWEQALENVALWKFSPVVSHNDLAAEQVLVDGDSITTVLGWSQCQVADPADDLAWLLAALPDDTIDTVIESYALARQEEPDPHLQTRALLAGELAVARWLMHGVRADDEEIIKDAVHMLQELDADVADTPLTK